MSEGDFEVLLAQDGWWVRLDRFRADMKAKDIHVGTSVQGAAPTCATCEEPWPCSKAGKGV